MRFWVVFRSERAVSTIFPPYIMPNGTYEIINFFSDTLPLNSTAGLPLRGRLQIAPISKPHTLDTSDKEVDLRRLKFETPKVVCIKGLFL